MAPFPDSDSDVLGSKDQCCELKGLLLHGSLELVLFSTDQEFSLKTPSPQNTCSCREKPWNVILRLYGVQKANKQSYKGTYCAFLAKINAVVFCFSEQSRNFGTVGHGSTAWLDHTDVVINHNLL